MVSINNENISVQKNWRIKIRRTLDICMTGIMLLLTAALTIGEAPHEWLGIAETEKQKKGGSPGNGYPVLFWLPLPPDFICFSGTACRIIFCLEHRLRIRPMADQ